MEALFLSSVNIHFAMAEGRSRVFTLEDAPPKPETLMITLRDKPTYWETIKETAKACKIESIVEVYRSEQQELMARIEKRGYATEEEAAQLNVKIEKKVRRVTKELQRRSVEALQVKPGDKPEQVRLKMSTTDKLVKWIAQLVDWLVKKLEEIFSVIKEAVQNSMEWCMDRTKELFDYLWSLFK